MSRSGVNDERELVEVYNAVRRGMSTREIAAMIHGEAAVARDWKPDSFMRTLTRRRIRKALRFMEGENPGPAPAG